MTTKNDDLSKSLRSIEECLAALHIQNYADTFNQALLECEKTAATPRMAVLYVLSRLVARKEAQKAEMLMKMAGFPILPTLENFDFTRIRSHYAALIQELADCAWIDRHETILFRGASGLGKTHLSIGLGKRAVSKGYSTVFIEASNLFEILRKADSEAAYRKKLMSFVRPNLLIIDDLGHNLQGHADYAPIFYAVIEGRRKRGGSTIITTNRTISEWPKILGGDVQCAIAAMDRFVENCHDFLFKGKSYRIRKFVNRKAAEMPSDDEAPDLTGLDGEEEGDHAD